MERRIFIVQGSVRLNVIFPAEHGHGSQGKARMRLPCGEHKVPDLYDACIKCKGAFDQAWR